MMDKEHFLGKRCQAILKRNHFRLTGIVLSVDENGIIFQTNQRTSFLGWDSLFELTLLEEVY